MTAKQSKMLEVLNLKYEGFSAFPNGERVLLAMAYLADVAVVREHGNNAGEWVEEILASTGLGPGYPWCAASINWCCETLGVPNPDKSDAAVIGWRNWAKASDKLKAAPKRGRLCYFLHANGTGHIGIVVNVRGTTVDSIEGNTSPGSEGSQRDGGGLYRRSRKASTWGGYIEL